MMIDKIASSFRDPSGFVFSENGQIFRQVNYSYKNNYDQLIQSGLYDNLISNQLLISHQALKVPPKFQGYKLIAPVEIPFISYPYEWCFGQLKDAALLTLNLQKKSLDKGMSLKDASSFNIQYFQGHPILIDTLSFENYPINRPWVAYRQFCEQFLAPLALASYDERLLHLLVPYLGSIPLDLVTRLLPISKKVNLGILVHLLLHAKSQSKYSTKNIGQLQQGSFSLNSLYGLIDNLQTTIEGLHPHQNKTNWNNYGLDCKDSYSKEALDQKQKLVHQYIQFIKSKYVWDLGANNGTFSRIAQSLGAFVVSLDSDHGAVEYNYQQAKINNEHNILPLWVDLINPSSNLGWNNEERDSLLGRPQPDTILALALIHHLVIANNLPMDWVAQFLANNCQSLIIEFVPKSDPQTQTLLQTREDIFNSYTQSEFEISFSKLFKIKKKSMINGSQRVLYLMTR